MIPRPRFRKFKSGRPTDYLKPDTPNNSTQVVNLFGGGLDVSQPAYLLEDNAATFIKNGFSKKGIFQKCPGLVLMGSNLPLDGEIFGFHNYKLANGSQKFLAVTGKSVYYLSGGSLWSYVTDGQNCFTADINRRVDSQTIYSETVGDFIVIFTNLYDYVKYYNSTNIQNLFTTWKAKYTKNYEFFQFYAYILEGGIYYPQKLYWSDIGKPGVITGGLSGGIVLAKTSDFLTGMGLVGGAMLIGKELSCSLLNYTGSAVSPFNLVENIFDIGVASGSTMVNFGKELIFLGSDKKVYLTDGATKKDVSVKIKGLFSDRLNWDRIHKSFAWTSPDEKWYFLSVPTAGYQVPSETWVLDVEDWEWQPFQVWDKMGAGNTFAKTGPKIGELTGKIGTFTWRIGQLIQLAHIGVLGDFDGYVYNYHTSYLNDVNTAIDSYVDTKDYIYDPKLMKRLTQLIVELSGSGGLDVYYSTDEGVSWTLIKTITMSSAFAEHFTYPDKNFQKIRFRFRCNALDTFYNLRRFDIDKIDKGHVKDVA